MDAWWMEVDGGWWLPSGGRVRWRRAAEWSNHLPRGKVGRSLARCCTLRLRTVYVCYGLVVVIATCELRAMNNEHGMNNYLLQSCKPQQIGGTEELYGGSWLSTLVIYTLLLLAQCLSSSLHPSPPRRALEHLILHLALAHFCRTLTLPLLYHLVRHRRHHRCINKERSRLCGDYSSRTSNFDHRHPLFQKRLQKGCRSRLFQDTNDPHCPTVRFFHCVVSLWHRWYYHRYDHNQSVLVVCCCEIVDRRQ